MNSRPILFSGPMVRAILAGRKTQTRRLVKPQPPSHFIHLERRTNLLRAWANDGLPHHAWKEQRCPYGQPGDQLWVRETWQVLRETCSYEIGEYDVFEWDADLYGDPQTQLLKDCPRGGHRAVIAYRADYEESFEGPWRPSLFMPRWASRLTLEVTSVRVERLHDIRESDARDEGVGIVLEEGDYEYLDGNPDQYRRGYKILWESIHGPTCWVGNPWVWVVEFKRVEVADHIDELRRALNQRP